MIQPRKIVFWAHLVAGLLAGLVILVLVVTGVALAYEKQMIAWADKVPGAARPTADAVRLSPAELIAKAHEADPKLSPASLLYHADPDAPVVATAGRDQRQILNAYTGQPLGEGSVGMRAFLQNMRQLHTNLLLPRPPRAEPGTPQPMNWGHTIVATANFVFLFIILSGLVIWIPRSIRWAALRSVLLFNFKLRGKPRDWNWHNVIGFWCLIPLLVMTVTGVILSYEWANRLMYKAVGSEPPGNMRPGRVERDPGAIAGTDATWQTALSYTPNWRALTVDMPVKSKDPLRVTVDEGSARQAQMQTVLRITRDGTISEAKPFAGREVGQRARAYARLGHTGEAFGVVGQTIAMLGCLGGVFLFYTGVALSFRRFLAWRTRRRMARWGAVPENFPATTADA